MFCWKCQKEILLENKKVGFREICPFCQADLHVCKNCKHLAYGKPHDCFIPNIEPVTDKEKYNFCEEFFPIQEKPTKSSSSKDEVSQRLFGEKPKNTKDFTSLFDD